MKNIVITGKRNIDKIFNPNKKHSRNESLKYTKKTNLNFNSYKNIDQIRFINKLYLDQIFNEREILEKEIKKKHYGYKKQDIDKNIYNETEFIKLSEIYEKIVISKLKCFYCSCNMLLLYDNVREPTQWTLDRIKNDFGHNENNVVISCLKCNIKRKTMDMEKFKFTKKLKIIKKNNSILNNGKNNLDKK